MSSTKLAIVTGANKGIGYGVAKALCERFDGDVFLTARDVGRGEDAVRRLNALGLAPAFHQLDVADDASVARFARFVADNYAGVDVLVNNAGCDVGPGSGAPFAARADLITRVNYFALRRVCDALFPLLRPGARVVNVSSSRGRLSLIPGDALKEEFSSPRLTADELDALVRRFVDRAAAGDHEAAGWPSCAYTVSKVAVTALTRVQQRQLDRADDVVVNSVHPGFVDTDMTRQLRSTTGWPSRWNGTVEQGAEAPVYLALLPKGEQNVRGQFVWSDKTVRDWRE